MHEEQLLQKSLSSSSYNQHVTDNDHIYVYAIDMLMRHIDIESSIVDFIGKEYVDILLTNNNNNNSNSEENNSRNHKCNIDQLKLLEKKLQTRSIVKRQLAFLKSALVEASQSIQQYDEGYLSMFKLNNCLEELRECIEMEFSVHVQAAVANSSSSNNDISIIALLDDKYNNDTYSINNKEAILKESCQAIFGNCFNVITTKSEAKTILDNEFNIKYEYYEKYYNSINQIISPIIQNLADTLQGSGGAQDQYQQYQQGSLEYSSIEKYLSNLETSIIEFEHEMNNTYIVIPQQHESNENDGNSSSTTTQQLRTILPNILPKNSLNLLRACCILTIKKRKQDAYNQLIENTEKNQLEHNLISKEKEINVLQVKLSQSRKQVNELVMSVNVLTDEIEMNQRYYAAQLARQNRRYDGY